MSPENITDGGEGPCRAGPPGCVRGSLAPRDLPDLPVCCVPWCFPSQELLCIRGGFGVFPPGSLEMPPSPRAPPALPPPPPPQPALRTLCWNAGTCFYFNSFPGIRPPKNQTLYFRPCANRESPLAPFCSFGKEENELPGGVCEDWRRERPLRSPRSSSRCIRIVPSICLMSVPFSPISVEIFALSPGASATKFCGILFSCRRGEIICSGLFFL